MIRKMKMKDSSGKTRELVYHQVMHIGEHIVHNPEMPEKAIKIKGSVDGVEHTIPLNELILNYGETPEESFWKRQYVPKTFHQYVPDVTDLWANETYYEGGVLKGLSEDDTRELLYFFDREMYRRNNGVWMVNENELVYLTEDHYFTLQWCKLFGIDNNNLPPWRERNFEYGEYREFQRDVFYLIKKVNNDPNILGLFVAKPKKTGITQVFCCYYLNKSTKSRQKMMGIMSKGEDAKNVNMMIFFHALEGLPQIFKPVTRDLAPVDGKVFFAEPSVKNIRTKRGQERLAELTNAKPLNTKVWAAKTKEAGFDSPTMSDIWFDEMAKYDTENRVDPEVIWERNQETVKQQDFYNGRVWITFYPPEYDTDGFHQTKKIWDDSKLETAKNDPFGRTASGLITHYISALNSYRSCIDKYGRCDFIEAARRNKIERDKVKHDRQKYQAKVRQYSETERECWQTSGAGSVFNNIRLADLLTDLEEELRGGVLPWKEGKMEWPNILWEASTWDQRPYRHFAAPTFNQLDRGDMMMGEEGRLRIYQDIPPRFRNRVLALGKDNKGNLMRPEAIQGIISVDPTDYAASSEVIQGSKNAILAINLPDLILDAQIGKGKPASKIIEMEYFYRPDNPLEMYEDLVKMIVYTGYVVIAEANKKWVATKLIQDGLGRYVIVKKKSTGKYTFWSPELHAAKDYSLISTETDDLETYVRVIARYISKPKPEEAEQGVRDYGATIKSERILKQLMNFTKEKSKFFDLVLALGIGLFGVDILLNPQTFQDDNQTNPIFENDLVAGILNSFYGINEELQF